MKKAPRLLIFIVLCLFFIILFILFIAKAPQRENITWGVDFSQMQAENLGLDWKKTYLAILEDLGSKKIKLHIQWDWVEGKRDNLYFEDIDWQISQAAKHNTQIIYVLGMKTGRWPECHLPEWFNPLSKQEQQEELLEYIKEVVLRYKNERSITYWQAENEPLFQFGECPWYDKSFLKKEVQLIKSIDSTRQVIVSDSGEWSLWFRAAGIGDIVGTTMYRIVWFHITDGLGFYAKLPFSPASYWIKSKIIKSFFGKEVINIELQAEPWTFKPFYDVSLEEQEKTMNLKQFKNNINYAKGTGFDTFYFWGAEWWYWLKEKQNKPEIWNEAKGLFK